MATYRVKRVEGIGPGKTSESWVQTFSDEYDAQEDAQHRAEAETNPAVAEYVVWQTFPKRAAIRIASYPIQRARS